MVSLRYRVDDVYYMAWVPHVIPRSVSVIMTIDFISGRVLHFMNDRGEQRTIVIDNYVDDVLVRVFPCKFYVVFVLAKFSFPLFCFIREFDCSFIYSF